VNKLLCLLLSGTTLFSCTFAAVKNKPVRLMAEAEDFEVVTGEWEELPYRENYFASTFAITFLSRMGALSAPPQVEKPAVAEMNIQLPYSGAFDVFARYEQPFEFSVEFTIQIEQNEEVVFDKKFGKISDERIWALSSTPAKRYTPMRRFWWGATDNIAWQKAPNQVELKKGPAVIRLIANKQLCTRAAKRNVDIVMLTNDKKGIQEQKDSDYSIPYLEMDGWLVQAGDLYIRLKNLGQKPASITLKPYFAGQHSPYFVNPRDWPKYRKVFGEGYTQPEVHYKYAGPRANAVDDKYIAKRLNKEGNNLAQDKI
jgi:hypothetical protein